MASVAKPPERLYPSTLAGATPEELRAEVRLLWGDLGMASAMINQTERRLDDCERLVRTITKTNNFMIKTLQQRIRDLMNGEGQ